MFTCGVLSNLALLWMWSRMPCASEQLTSATLEHAFCSRSIGRSEQWVCYDAAQNSGKCFDVLFYVLKTDISSASVLWWKTLMKSALELGYSSPSTFVPQSLFILTSVSAWAQAWVCNMGRMYNWCVCFSRQSPPCINDKREKNLSEQN